MTGGSHAEARAIAPPRFAGLVLAAVHSVVAVTTARVGKGHRSSPPGSDTFAVDTLTKERVERRCHTHDGKSRTAAPSYARGAPSRHWPAGKGERRSRG